MESKKHYNLSTTEDNGQSITTTNTSTEHPAEILRMMQLAGIQGSPVVHQHEESIEEEVDSEFKPTPANDKLDLDDYSKKSPESINKQQKSIQPNHGDNPLEYSIDESEIYESLMSEFERTDEIAPAVAAVGGALARGALAVGKAIIGNPMKSVVAHSVLTGGGDDEPVNASAKKKKGKKLNAVKEETEELEEAQSPAQKAAFAKMLAAKKGKKDDTVEETTDELKEETISEDCGCGHGSDCDCGPECDCGCNAVNETTENNMSEDQARIRELAGMDAQSINEDESVWNQFLKLNDEMDFESEDRIFFSLKHWPKHRFELHGDIDGKDTKSGGVHLGVLVSREDGDDDNFAGNKSMPQDEIKANITGAAWVGSDSDIKGTAGDYKEFSDIHPEPYDDKEPEDQHKNIHAFSKDASGEYHNKDEDTSESVDVEEDGAAISGAIAKHKHNSRKRTYNDDGKAPKAGHHNTTSNRWAESTEEVATEDESLNESQKRLAKLIKY